MSIKITAQLDLENMTDPELADLQISVNRTINSRRPRLQLNIAERCMVACGHTIAAVKSYRTRTKLGLRECKDECDAFKATLQAFEKLDDRLSVPPNCEYPE